MQIVGIVVEYVVEPRAKVDVNVAKEVPLAAKFLTVAFNGAVVIPAAVESFIASVTAKSVGRFVVEVSKMLTAFATIAARAMFATFTARAMLATFTARAAFARQATMAFKAILTIWATATTKGHSAAIVYSINWLLATQCL